MGWSFSSDQETLTDWALIQNSDSIELGDAMLAQVNTHTGGNMETNSGRNKDAERVRQFIRDPETASELRRILDGVCHHHQISHLVLVSPIRTRSVVSARFSAYWLIRERLNMSYTLIGALLDRDHRTVMNGIAKTNRARTQAILEGWSHPVDRIQKFIGPTRHREAIHDHRI